MTWATRATAKALYGLAGAGDSTLGELAKAGELRWRAAPGLISERAWVIWNMPACASDAAMSNGDQNSLRGVDASF